MSKPKPEPVPVSYPSHGGTYIETANGIVPLADVTPVEPAQEGTTYDA